MTAKLELNQCEAAKYFLICKTWREVDQKEIHPARTEAATDIQILLEIGGSILEGRGIIFV